MRSPVEIEALVFTLKSGSQGTEIVFLNQNLAICVASIVRNFHADFLGAVSHRLFDLVDEARNRPGPIKFDENALDGVGALAQPTCASRTRMAVEQILYWICRILGRASDGRAASDIDFIAGACRRHISGQGSFAKRRAFRHLLLSTIGTGVHPPENRETLVVPGLRRGGIMAPAACQRERGVDTPARPISVVECDGSYHRLFSVSGLRPETSAVFNPLPSLAERADNGAVAAGDAA